MMTAPTSWGLHLPRCVLVPITGHPCSLFLAPHTPPLLVFTTVMASLWASGQAPALCGMWQEHTLAHTSHVSFILERGAIFWLQRQFRLLRRGLSRSGAHFWGPALRPGLDPSAGQMSPASGAPASLVPADTEVGEGGLCTRPVVPAGESRHSPFPRTVVPGGSPCTGFTSRAPRCPERLSLCK